MTAEAIEIKLPDGPSSNWVPTVVDDVIVFTRWEHDEDPPHPFDDEENNGRILSFNSKHRNFIGYGKEDEIEDLITNHDAVELSYFEHGNILWMVKDSPAPAGVEFQWDGVRRAGLWVPDEGALENIGSVTGDARKEALRKYAADVCETYTDFCNGSVYTYDVEIYPLLKRLDGTPRENYSAYEDAPGAEDSGSNYYGWETLQTQLESAAKSTLKNYLSKR